MHWTKEAKRPSTTPTTVETQKNEYLSNKKRLLGGQEAFLDALASLKTMFKIKSLMFSRLQDFKSITAY